MKIVIEVRGGCVTEVRCTDPKAEVILIDWDAEEDFERRENKSEAERTAKWPVVL